MNVQVDVIMTVTHLAVSVYRVPRNEVLFCDFAILLEIRYNFLIPFLGTNPKGALDNGS